MGSNPFAQMTRDHLPAQTNAKQRRVFFQRDADKVDLLFHPVIRIVDAHRPAQNDRARMIRQRRRQGIAKARPAQIELIAHRVQQAAYARRAGVLLMQHDENASSRRLVARTHGASFMAHLSSRNRL